MLTDLEILSLILKINENDLSKHRSWVIKQKSMVKDLNSYSALLKIILLGSFISGIIIAVLGIIMIFQGATGETEFNFFGQEFKSTNVGIAAIFLGGSLIVLLIKRSLKSLDSTFKISSGSHLGSDRTDKNSEKSYEKIFDILSTYRAFFKGDEQLIADTEYAISNHGLFKQLGYLDAGRAVAVAGSFAATTKKFQKELSKLETEDNPELKKKLSSLIVACKDYVEKYGKKENTILPLPHIGWNQRMRDFNIYPNHFNFNSDDSIEVFKQLLEYLSNSCKDLIFIRELTIGIIDNVKEQNDNLAERGDNISAEILNGIKSLNQIVDKFREVISIIEEINSKTAIFDERRKLLKEKSQKSDGIVSYLLKAISKVKSSKAWEISNSKTIITRAEYLDNYKLKVYFSDGQKFDIKLGNEIWEDFCGFHMGEDIFKTFFVDLDQNEIRWKKESRARVTGEQIRNHLNVYREQN